jgi:hypothetical protein
MYAKRLDDDDDEDPHAPRNANPASSMKAKIPLET